MVEKLIQAVLVAVIALILYGIWLLWPEKFPIMLVGFLTIYIFGMLLENARSQEEKRRTTQKERRQICTTSN